MTHSIHGIDEYLDDIDDFSRDLLANLSDDELEFLHYDSEGNYVESGEESEEDE